MIIGKLLDPKIDYVFKRIFGHVGNEDITASLISSIINKKVSDIELDSNPILEKDLMDDKIGILDIRAKIDNSINCDIELQVVDRKNIKKRILFYWSKLYSKSIKSGHNYSELEKSIVILISDYEIEGLEQIEKYMSKWNIREEEYKQIILTDMMELYIIEMPKVSKYKEKMKNKQLNSWVKFIESPGMIKMNEENKEIKKAKEVLEEINQDEREIYLAELRQKYIMDQNDIEAAGFDKGQKKAKIDIAKKLKEKNIDIKIISETTDLSIEEIKNIK